MKISFKIEGDDEGKFLRKLQESGMNKSEFIRSCIFESNVVSRTNQNRDKELYQGIYKIKEAIDITKAKYRETNMEDVERKLNELCHILLNS